MMKKAKKEHRTFMEVAVHNNMPPKMQKRYVAYMTARWESDEEGKCLCGYAQEWADRFCVGSEYENSDSKGQAILKSLDAKCKF